MIGGLGSFEHLLYEKATPEHHILELLKGV